MADTVIREVTFSRFLIFMLPCAIETGHQGRLDVLSVRSGLSEPTYQLIVPLVRSPGTACSLSAVDRPLSNSGMEVSGCSPRHLWIVKRKLRSTTLVQSSVFLSTLTSMIIHDTYYPGTSSTQIAFTISICWSSRWHTQMPRSLEWKIQSRG